VFLLTKAARYFYDADAVREAHTAAPRIPGGYAPEKAIGPQHRNGASQCERQRTIQESYHTNGRNLRSVWTIATESFDGAHFVVHGERGRFLVPDSSAVDIHSFSRTDLSLGEQDTSLYMSLWQEVIDAYMD
jgi:hypothetical protein